jgi:hypothetical protein
MSSNSLSDSPLPQFCIQAEGKTGEWAFIQAAGTNIKDISPGTALKDARVVSCKGDVDNEQPPFGDIHCPEVWQPRCWVGRPYSGNDISCLDIQLICIRLFQCQCHIVPLGQLFNRKVLNITHVVYPLNVAGWSDWATPWDRKVWCIKGI